MNRRNFLTSLVGIFAAPFVVKKATAVAPTVKRYTVAVDWCRDSVTTPDCHSAALVKVGPKFKIQMIDRWNAKKETLPAWQDRMDRLQSRIPGRRPV